MLGRQWGSTVLSATYSTTWVTVVLRPLWKVSEVVA